MRQIHKKANSPIKDLVYQVGKNTNNSTIRQQLLIEQNQICAYTETYLDRTSSHPIEHFNPTLKETINDGYFNYFICKDQWNNEKGTTVRWNKFQPILHPTANDFNARITFLDGFYFANQEDLPAKNLVQYLKLNDAGLSKNRQRYIERKRKEIAWSQLSPQAFFDELLQEEPDHVYFIRAIEETFEVKINFDLR